MRSAFPRLGCCGGLLLAAVTVTASAQARWVMGVKRIPGQSPVFVASTFAELRPGASDSYALSLVCGLDRLSVSVSTGRALQWQPSMRDPGDSFVPVEVSVDDRGAQRAVLLREAEGTGRLANWMLVMRAQYESPGLSEVLRRETFGFGAKGLPARRVTIAGLAAEPIEFRLDTLTDTDRQRVQQACFAIDEARRADEACRQEARKRGILEFEAKVADANRTWCETTRDGRRQQLVDEFLRGVASARNGGSRLAAAFGEFIAANPDVIVADGTGGTQSCPDPYFVVDTARLRPLLERTASPEVAARRLEELLKESGLVVTSRELKFEPARPTVDRRAWNLAIEEAESSCTRAREIR